MSLSPGGNHHPAMLGRHVPCDGICGNSLLRRRKPTSSSSDVKWAQIESARTRGRSSVSPQESEDSSVTVKLTTRQPADANVAMLSCSG